MDFYAFVRPHGGSELKQVLEMQGSGLNIADFQQNNELRWLSGSRGITAGSLGFDLMNGTKKTISVSIAPRSDFSTGSLDVDLFQRRFLSDGQTEDSKAFVKYESAPFHNMSLEQMKNGFTLGVHLGGQEVVKSLSAQEVQNMFPNSIDKIKALGVAMAQGQAVDYLQDALKQLENAVEQMKLGFIIQGLRITEWEEYKTHLPVFLELNEKYVGFDKVFSAIGLTIPEAIDIYAEKAKQEPLTAKTVLEDLQKRAVEATPNSFNKTLSYDPGDLKRIMRLLQIHEEVMNKIPKMTDMALKRYTLEHLHKDSVELYVKVLRELYQKAYGRMPKDNRELYAFFKQHPPLWDFPYNKMRSDTSHRLFEVYDDYTDADLHRDANVILVKALTGMVAKHVYLTNFYKQTLPTVLMGFKELDDSKLAI